MILAIHVDMTDEEILRACVENYASDSNYNGYEKDFDGSGRVSFIKPWITRDKGECARRALKIIDERNRKRQGRN